MARRPVDPSRLRLSTETEPGLVVGSGRGGDYEVRAGDRALACRLRGRLKIAEADHLNHLTVGDEVVVRASLDEPERGLIEEVRPRRSYIGRGRPDKAPQIIAANVDQVMVVVACQQPLCSLHTIDRFLAIAASTAMPARLVLNKCDLDPTGEIQEAIEDIYEPLELPVLCTSVLTAQGLTDFAAALADRITVIIGPSGAGKSSLLNAVNPGYQLATGEVMSIGKGRHTTTGSRLLPLDCGGFVADTPGIKTLQIIDGLVTPLALARLFPEMLPFVGRCRFNDCSHRSEPDCAVQDEVGESIAPSRYESYLILYEEVVAATRLY